MDNSFETYRGVIEQINKLSEPQRRLYEQMKKWNEPYLRMQEQMKKWNEPYLRMQEQMKKWNEPYLRMQEQMKKWNEPYLRMQEQMKKWNEPYLRMQEQMKNWYEPYQRMQEQMENWHEPYQRMQEQINRWKKDNWDYNNTIDILKSSTIVDQIISDATSNSAYDNISVNQTGTVSIGGETLSTKEISDVYSDFVKALNAIPSPTQAFEFIYRYIDNLKKPLKYFLLIFFFPFWINFLSNLSTDYYKNEIVRMVNKPKREIIKTIKRDARQDFDIEYLKMYRFVTATSLNVRSGPSTKHTKIAIISFAQVVKVNTKGRHWTKIEYIEEETDETIQGWVFNRYLQSFSK